MITFVYGGSVSKSIFLPFEWLRKGKKKWKKEK
ncbi:hypothetical protein DORLON_00153 [Dorea longicatena DSM 13814]|uniref:Uncharacterized protein n=1 Tax=Dorea longicatena DSM 13814 TaxID=411462 RepID=A6BCZ0_9FIRM|nr:hypothetical protein DORLON_00153 [Dorea longicatena DSM 13814]